MRFRTIIALAGLAITLSSCGREMLREYEYEEEIFLDVDGSATVVVNASIPALVALRGLDVNPDPHARFDRRRLETAYASPVTRVRRISQPWYRDGRRFVQVRLDVPDVRRLGEAAPFAWSTYRFDATATELVYHQIVGAAAAVGVDRTGWTGGELVAVRIHLPSRIHYHNVRRLEDGAPGQVQRGNILVWEQRLTDRLKGVPLDVEARIEPQSILSATLQIYGIATIAALVVVVGLIVWTLRGRRQEN